jgi:FkbM family methyltransferase
VNDKRWRDWLLGQAKPGDRFVDVGANVGVYSVPMAAQVGQTGHVWAIEPNPMAYQALQGKLDKSLSNLSLLYRVATDHKDVLPLYLSGKSEHSSLYPLAVTSYADKHPMLARVSVEANSLDSMIEVGELPPHTHWIKVDTQGAEGAVLTGAKYYLADPATVWLVEVWDYGLRAAGWTVERLCSLCAGAGLVAFDLGKGDRPVAVEWQELIRYAKASESYSAVNAGMAYPMRLKELMR